MIDIEERKDFILWAKAQKIQSFKLDDLEVNFSPMAFVPEYIDGPSEEPSNDPKYDIKDVDEDLLFHSAN